LSAVVVTETLTHLLDYYYTEFAVMLYKGPCCWQSST